MRGFPAGASLVGSAVLAALLTFVMMRVHFAAVWRTGAFFDTDDAMHMVQARALLNGQNWFDMTVYGLDPPSGTFMHWSRLVDVPLVLLIKLFGLVTGAAEAERLTRLVFPFLLLVGLYLAMARLATSLLGPEARLPTIAATLLSGSGVVQFLPGRIDHHAPQIVILVVMIGAVIAALEREHARRAALAGVLVGLSLAINLENLPFIITLTAALVGVWIWRGDAIGPALGWYAGGMALGLPLFFVAITAPASYLAPVCDAFGAAHLGAGVIGATCCACAVLSAPRLETRLRRGAAAFAITIAVAAFVALAYPVCLRNPFAGVDPLVREIWLARVEESLPLLTVLRREPETAIFSFVPVALGLFGCLVATCCASGLQRDRFTLLAVVVATGLAMAFWQVRVFSSITAIALCGGLYVAIECQRYWRARGRDAFASLSLALIFPFTATAVSIVLPADAASAPSAQMRDAGASRASTADQCLAPAAFAPFRHLAGSVIAPIDAGSYFLVHTDLTAFAAAFHRDNDGNHFALATMLASPEAAGRMAAQRHVGYIAICGGLSETRLLADRAPNSLAADLLAGKTPDWLANVPLPGTPFSVFKVLSDTSRS